MVDKQAKTSLSLEPTSFKIPFSNFKPSINKYILEEWQTSWNNSIGNKLLDIKPTIGEYQSVVRNIRREEVVLARLRLGHTRVTHSYLLQGEEQPQCVGCDAPFTVCHFLLECGDFAQVRNEPRSDKRDLLAIKVKSEIFAEKERPNCCEQLPKILRDYLYK